MVEETLLIGQQGRQYGILAATPFDHGSTSQLFLGEQVAPQEQAGRKVAIKIGLGSDVKTVFAREAQVLTLLGDIVPGAVPELYETDLEAERPFLVMEYLASARPLTDLGQGGVQEYLPEKDAVNWAVRYGEVLGALHDVEFAAPDRKLGDLLLVNGNPSAGADRTSVSQDNPRLVVVDWGGVASLTPSLAQFDLLLFAQFWYRLMLGGQSLPDIRLGTRRPEHHRRWQELSYGARQILSRGLSRVTQRRYSEVSRLIDDWRELQVLWNRSSADLERAFEEARQDKTYEKALKCLDLIRLIDRPRWHRRAAEIDSLLNEIDNVNLLIKQIKEAIRRGESLADANVKEPLARGAEGYGDDPEWQLRARRWQLLAEFSSGLEDQVQQVFRETLVEPWIQAIEAVEDERWEEALDLFWEPLHRVVSPNHDSPEFEAELIQAREFLHSGKRIEAQERIKAVNGKLHQLDTIATRSAASLLDNTFLPRYSRWGGILALLIETEIRNHMLAFTEHLSMGRQQEVYAASDAIRGLRGQLSYTSLLETAEAIWPQELLKSLDQQLDLCEMVDEALAEAADLSSQGKFEQARWILSAADRKFDFLKPSEPDSAHSLISEVNSITQVKRRELKAELEKVVDLIHAEELLTQSTRSHDFSQIVAALEAAKDVLDNPYLKQRSAGLVDQVNQILRCGPTLITLETSQGERQEGLAEGELA